MVAPAAHFEHLFILGDLHGRWSQDDNRFFNQKTRSLLLFVGDLGVSQKKRDLELLGSIARLHQPAYLLPGNNDQPYLDHLHAELIYQAGRKEILRGRSALSSIVQFAGYSLIPISLQGRRLNLLFARPCAMGGSELSFPETLRERYGIESLADSTARMIELIEESDSAPLLFIAHNGPFGQGDSANDQWGRDFPAPDGAPLDWGDRDLQEAIEYAQTKRKVLGCVAGHMHRQPRGNSRPFLTENSGIQYINPAVVPRVRSDENGEFRHYVSVQWQDEARLRFNEEWFLAR